MENLIIEMLILLNEALNSSFDEIIFALVLLDFIAIVIEFIENFLLLCVGQSEIFLEVEFLIVEEGIFLIEFLYFFLELFGLSIVSGHILLMIIEFLNEFIGLIAGDSKFFLSCSELIMKVSVFASDFLELFIEVMELSG